MFDSCLSFLHNRFKLELTFGAEIEFYYSGSLDALQEKCPHMNISEEEGEQHYEAVTQVISDPNDMVSLINHFRQELANHAKELKQQLSFNPKPYSNRPGSAMHFHIGLLGDNASDLLDFGIGGMCQLMVQSMIHFAPHSTSYSRFSNPDIHTPTTVSWGSKNNRSVAIRKFAALNRAEHRVSGSDCNPQAALTAITHSLTLGIEKSIQPPKPIYGIASDSFYGATKLPITLEEARQTVYSLDLTW